MSFSAVDQRFVSEYALFQRSIKKLFELFLWLCEKIQPILDSIIVLPIEVLAKSLFQVNDILVSWTYGLKDSSCSLKASQPWDVRMIAVIGSFDSSFLSFWY
eukprot:TRINITY_DN1092_c0_g1_i1.p1 TRINITY_DN1092_c0_g1~~TRINITY_DN1092_c0_g1_i1.p1  ORF type:complete len:102 (+),score=10.66 TRINITY_DN1092_c0_g1_i1:3-308(+)